MLGWQISLLAIAVVGVNVAAVFKSLTLPIQAGVRLQELVGAVSLGFIVLYLITLRASLTMIRRLDVQLVHDLHRTRVRRALGADGLPSRRDKVGDRL